MWESVRGSGCRGTHFYFGATRAMKLTEEWAQKNIDRTLDGVEVVSLEETGGRRHRVVRLYVDHPDGVNHALCARVSGACLLYTSDAADDLLCVDLGGRRIIKKKKKQNK